MADEFESINSRMPDLSTALAQRIAARQGNGQSNPVPHGTVDPYQLLLQKRREETSPVDPSTVKRWPEEATKKLQDYCTKMGIVGFNSGLMHPIAALAMLKKQYGDDFTDVPLNERVPNGYEKLGSSTKYGSNYPYSEAINKKQILHG